MGYSACLGTNISVSHRRKIGLAGLDDDNVAQLVFWKAAVQQGFRYKQPWARRAVSRLSMRVYGFGEYTLKEPQPSSGNHFIIYNCPPLAR